MQHNGAMPNKAVLFRGPASAWLMPTASIGIVFWLGVVATGGMAAHGSLFWAIWLAVFATLLLAPARAAVLVAGDMLVIRNAFQTYRVPRLTVAGTGIGPFYPGLVGVQLTTTGGETIQIDAAARISWWPGLSRLERKRARLERWLRGGHLRH